MTVNDRFASIQTRVAAACERAGRDRGEVTLLGASKRQPIERMQAAWDAGLRVFGENRVQEALAKIPQFPPDAEWHLIGPLQTNKARNVVGNFSTIQSVDRMKVATVLEREATRHDAVLDGFIEVNLGDEESKHGFSVDGFVANVRSLADLEHLRIVGLMAIPPFSSEPEGSRQWFRRLRELRDLLFSCTEWADRPGFLSMGMSLDYEVAIEEGATHVRIGTALFGQRDS